MQIGVPVINNDVSFVVSEGRGFDAPFLRDRPVEHLGTRRHFIYCHSWEILVQDRECLAYSVAGDASVDGPKTPGEIVKELPSDRRHRYEFRGRRMKRWSREPRPTREAQQLIAGS